MQNQQLRSTHQHQVQRALIIAHDPVIQTTSRNTLQHARWQVETCASYTQFQTLPRQSGWPLVVVADDGQDLPERVLHALQSDIAEQRSFVIVLARTPSVAQAIHYTELKAFDYLLPPLEPMALLTLAAKVRDRSVYLTAATPSLPAAPDTTDQACRLLGQSAAMIELSKQVVKLAPVRDLRLFLAGETGTGKEVIAHKLHELSGCAGPFLAVNCAAMAETLLESELFGHEKGAFTGALHLKQGLWELAENGTLFLDEITEAAPNVQAKLLRALQENVIRRVGSNREIKVNARVIAASNRNLSTAVEEKTFRHDLYYRLGQPLRVPPLRERREDIPLLAEHFSRRAVPHCVIAPEAMNLLCSWHWPGNVRELESVMLKLTYLAGGVILPDHVRQQIQPAQIVAPWMSLPFLSALEVISDEQFPSMHVLRNWYAAVLYFHGCSEAEIARRLGLDPRTVAKALQEARAQFPLYEHALAA